MFLPFRVPSKEQAITKVQPSSPSTIASLGSTLPLKLRNAEGIAITSLVQLATALTLPSLKAASSGTLGTTRRLFRLSSAVKKLLGPDIPSARLRQPVLDVQPVRGRTSITSPTTLLLALRVGTTPGLPTLSGLSPTA